MLLPVRHSETAGPNIYRYFTCIVTPALQPHCSTTGSLNYVCLAAPQVLLTNAHKYSKGLLSEILDFVMGKGLIPADGEIWRTRR